jgi:PAS domain S-box-containing protein
MGMTVKSRAKQSNTDGKQRGGTLPWREAGFQELADNISDGVFCINPAGYFTFVNKVVTERSGMRPDKFYASHFLDIVHPVYRDETVQNFQRVMRGENGIPYELKYESADGQLKIVEVHSRPLLIGGKVVGLLGIVRNIMERKQAEALLRQREASYRAVVEDQEEMICRFLPDSTLTFVNDAYCRFFGKNKDELLGRKFLPFVADEDREIVMQRIAMLSKENPREVHDQRSFTVSGDMCWQQWVNRALFDEQGCVTEIQAVGRDITTLKKMEEQLRESEEQFRGLIENMPIGIFIYEGTKIRYLNPACERFTGYTWSELYLSDIWDLVHPEFKETVKEYVIKRQRKEPVPELHVVKIITKSGDERWVERSAIAIELKEKTSVLVTIMDITERRRAEETLRKSEEKYRALVENSSDPILLADEHGNLIEVNRMAEKLLGYTREELLQMNYTQIHPATERERTITAFENIAQDGHGSLKNGAILRKDGTAVPVDITANAIEYSGSRVFQASFRDISEHKQIEDTLERLVRERTVELSEKNAQLIEEIKERRRVDAALQKKKKELMLNADKLEKMNTALKVLLKQREEDKRELEEKVMTNVKELLIPYLEKLKTSRLDAKDKVHVSILDENLKNIISPFTHRLSSKYSGFTPREIQVANLIKQGNSTKDIAEFLGISRSAINLHRNSIRHKLGIITKKINLRSYLMSLS